ncbi:MAG: hypothetical protein HON76_19665 [Candidatus Scalindua sp.]|jgi:uncharacterized membrane protein YkgB|nr:hypothetical protein [Candidatus Scalindua sp.]MBT5304234.1 hypothetical protein [Candidatus Scalindua sp.]MBT6049074.1 hypothetical protein [Candidatus Scalindua sp.]MBT6226018.1 hypothetical protein [Candidatus Scalindua sp.]MBT6564737.1 hypothetical protein [Candidatus Scalindua sp.]
MLKLHWLTKRYKTMDTNNIYKTINLIGILSELIGILLISYEVLNQYKGTKFYIDEPTWDRSVQIPQETNKYKEWEKTKYKSMKLGIVILLFGLLMDISPIFISNEIKHIKDYKVLYNHILGK